jgi:hypothetical protein
MRFFYVLWAMITGRNASSTPVSIIQTQLQEKRSIPLGLTEFHSWSDRIIAGAMIPGVTAETQKYTLANMILNLAPTAAYVEDLYFINGMRKFAANQVADYYRKELYAAKQAKLAAEEAKKQKQGEATPLKVIKDEAMADNKV